MLVNKSANDTDDTTAGDRADTSAELGGGGDEFGDGQALPPDGEAIIGGCPDPKNCTDPKLTVDTDSGQREAA